MRAKGKQTRYNLEAIEQIAAKLKALPKVEPKKKELNKSEAVKVLDKEIKSLQKRGYTLKMIAEILTMHELNISESVLKSYLKRAEEKSTNEATTEEAKSAKAKATETKNTDATESTLNVEVNADKKNKTAAARNKPNNVGDI